MTTSNPTQELLELARKIGQRDDSVGGVRKLQAYFQERFTDCLDRGADPNSCDKDGWDALELIGRIGEKSTQLANKCVQLLLARGFDFIDRDGPAKLRGTLMERTLQYLARQAREGRHFTGHNGENVLHYMAYYQPAVLHHWLQMDRITRKQGRPLFDDSQATLNRTDGASPLHLVWREHRLGLPEKAQIERWQITRYLVALGASLEARNGREHDVYHLIDHQLATGKMQLPGQAADMADQAFSATVQQYLLDRATPEPQAGAQRKAPRL